jgi:hypothetical protein
MARSDDRHQEKLERQRAERRRREKIDKLKLERDREMHTVWERHQEKIRQARG